MFSAINHYQKLTPKCHDLHYNLGLRRDQISALVFRHWGCYIYISASLNHCKIFRFLQVRHERTLNIKCA